MLKSTSMKTLVTLLMACFILMASSPNLRGVEARYLMTRSDPLLSPVGPPYGKDPRFDRLYDIITKLLRNGGGDLEYQIKSQLDNGP
ncbi:M4-Proctolin precursor [Daphnia sinensis]|uniref:M4-Proctolin n=1 Tax=Daphnia sinensis TaxID=1820382 RepID=A0AAD5PXL9_9CRUS|nr:M4-Proctolin precursor [Daphnia sinensis]